MNFFQADLAGCHLASGVVVVIDVCRAFTTAAYALAGGAKRVVLVESVEEALRLRERIPGALAMGELDGMPAPGFDFWNSPTQVAAAGTSLAGRTIIQRTSAGTQGVVRSARADHLFAASLVVAEATVQAIQKLGAEAVTWVPTGWKAGQANSGIEDIACATYLAERLQGRKPDPALYLDWKPILLQKNYPGVETELVRCYHADLELCARVDAFDFAMQVERQEGRLELLAIRPERSLS